MSKRLKIVFICFISLYIIMCLLIRVFFNFQYQTAKELFNDGKYQAAAVIFDKLGVFGDSQIYLQNCNNNLEYQKALELFESQNFYDAFQVFFELKDFEDGEIYMAKSALNSLDAFREIIYDKALQYFTYGDYRNALVNFQELGEFRDSSEFVHKCQTALDSYI